MAASEGHEAHEGVEAVEVRGKQFHCPDCDSTFETKQGLGAHRARKHGYRRLEEGTSAPAPDGQGNGEAFVGGESSSTYLVALGQFLPVLAEEIDYRSLDSLDQDDLTKAFFLLYRDQANV